MKQYQQASTILQNAKKEITDLLTGEEDQLHALRISHSIQREIDRLGAVTGTDAENMTRVETLGPPKTIFGQAVARPTKAEDLSPRKAQVEAFKADVEAAHETFTTSDSEQLLKTLSDAVIRGVAKKAGMTVTKDDPKKLTIAFVEKVKKAIIQKKQDAADVILKAENKVVELASGKDEAELALNTANESGDTEAVAQAQAAFEKAVDDHFSAVKELNELKGVA